MIDRTVVILFKIEQQIARFHITILFFGKCCIFSVPEDLSGCLLQVVGMCPGAEILTGSAVNLYDKISAVDLTGK